MRLPGITIAVAMMLAAVTSASAEDLFLVSGEYLVDDVTHTTPQVFNLVEVGSGGQATLRVLDGRLFRVTQDMLIGFTAFGLGSGTGIVNVMGSHSRVEVAGLLGIGRNYNNFPGFVGMGTVNIVAGGHVRAGSVEMPSTLNPAQGFVTISGPGSLLEVVNGLSLRQNGPVASIATIETGGTLSVGTTVVVTNGSPKIRLEGGTLSLTGPSAVPPPSVLEYDSGSFRFRSSQTLNGAAGFYTDFYGSPPVLGAGRGLVIDGVTTLSTSLSIAGGSLRTTSIAVTPGTGSVLLAGGASTLTGEGAVIDDGADFGPNPLTVGDGTGDAARLELRGAGSVLLGDVTVMDDGALSFSGEALVVDSLDNSGTVTITQATLDARGGLVNTGSLRLAGAVVEGDVTSPAGSRIDVSGTVVFNGAFSGAAAFYGSGTVVFNGAFSGPASFHGTSAPVFNRPIAASRPH